MKRFLYELSESWKIAAAQMRSNLTRSTLTALGVIIGIIAVTLMGTAVSGISIGFDKSMAVLGDDVLYVTQWPWKPVDDWWNYRDRKKIKTEYAETLNRMIAATPNSTLVVAVPTSNQDFARSGRRNHCIARRGWDAGQERRPAGEN
jgi:putative ABC transport system permease protein